MFTAFSFNIRTLRGSLPLLVLAITLLALAPVSSRAEYQKAVYPQTEARVTEITVSAPETVAPGQTFAATIVVDAASPLPPDQRMYLYLVRDGAARMALDFAPRPSADRWKHGQNRLAPIEIKVPAGQLPAGDYTLVAGLYRQATEGKTPLKITGDDPARPGKIVTRGKMVDKYGVGHEWYINEAHTLIWNGRPWMPAGGMIVYDRDWNLVKAQIDLLHRYGVRDVYLHLGVNQPYPWKTYSDDDYAYFQQTIDYLDDLGFTYGLEFQALEAKGPGYYYPAPGPRKDVTGSGTVTVEQDRTLGGYFAVFERDSWEVVQTGAVSVSDRKTVEADVRVPREGNYQVVFALEREAEGMYSMYYWDDKYTNYLDVVRKHYSKVNLGPGFRFLVDPLWNEMNMNRDFFPSAPEYYRQFHEWLQKRYGTLQNLNEAWDPASELASFEQAARLIPLDRKDLPPTGRLHQFLLDPQDRSVVTLDLTTSQYNYDAQEFLGRSLLHYTNHIADEFKKLYDVPVIYKGFSDMDFWHINDTALPGGHDGLGMESYGNGEPMMLFMAAHLFGELEQATKTTWLIVTETGEGNHQDNSPSRNKMPGYTSRLGTMYANFNALVSGGAKGIYQFNMVPGGGTNDPWTDALVTDPRQLEWVATYARILDNSPDLVDYKPHMYFRFPGMYNPNSMSLASEPAGDYYGFGGWWWREPVERSENDIWIVPSFSLRPETPMFIVNLENMPATERHREELTKALEDGVRITQIGFRKDLGAIPAVDKYYSEVFSTDEDGRRFQVLKATPESRVLGRNKTGEIWNLIDGNLQIVSKEVFGLHGYRPEHLEVGAEQNPDPYYGVFADLMGVELLTLPEGLHGFRYHDNDTPVTVIGIGDETRTLSFDIPPDAEATAVYPGGESAPEIRSGKLVVRLKPVDRTLQKLDQLPDRDRYRFLRDGIVVPTLDAQDSVIIRGLPRESAIPMEAAREALSSARDEHAALPEPEAALFSHVQDKAQTEFEQREFESALQTIKEQGDRFFASATPYIWIEGEDRLESNFNYSALGGIPTLSGGAFLGLETAVPPPTDTGWYADYKFEANEPGVYQLWLRENYLAYSSPSAWRIDSGEWRQAPNTLAPHDIQVVALYNAVEDTRQVFAWYHYGHVYLEKGLHTLSIRVDQERGRGLAVTMADDRQYAKMIDAILLTARGFVPDGKKKPRSIINEIKPPLVNLAPGPSFEFRPDPDAKEPAGWTRSEASDDVRWQDAGWGAYNVMPGVEFNLGQRYAYVGQRNLTIQAGPAERWWRSDAIPVEPGEDYLLEVFVRQVKLGSSAGIAVEFLDSSGGSIARHSSVSETGSFDWRKPSVQATAPPEAAGARVILLVTPGSEGLAYFDDVMFARIPDPGS